MVELEGLVAGDARNRCPAREIGVGEGVDHFAAEGLRVVRHVEPDAQPLRHASCVVRVLERAASRLALREPHRHADRLGAGLDQQGRRDRRVDATRHRHDDPIARGRFEPRIPSRCLGRPHLAERARRAARPHGRSAPRPRPSRPRAEDSRAPAPACGPSPSAPSTARSRRNDRPRPRTPRSPRDRAPGRGPHPPRPRTRGSACSSVDATDPRSNAVHRVGRRVPRRADPAARDSARPACRAPRERAPRRHRSRRSRPYSRCRRDAPAPVRRP